MTTEPTVKPDDYIDPLDVLIVVELRHGAKIVKADLHHAIQHRTEDRADAMAVVGWLLERRTDPNADLGKWRQWPLEKVATESSVLAGNPRSMFEPDPASATTPEDAAGADLVIGTAVTAPPTTADAAIVAEAPAESPSPPTS